MKTLLGALICFVLNSSQAFAISGGPWGGTDHPTVTGTYAGVLVPLLIVVAPGPPPVTLPPDNSLALFTLTIPKTGLGSGDAAVFRNGYFYPASIVGTGDPDTAKVSAIIDASVALGCATLNGSGGFETVKVVVKSGGLATDSTRLKGTAALTYNCIVTNETLLGCSGCNDPATNSGGAIQYRVKGFKQSESSS